MVLALAAWCLTGSLALAQFGLPDAGCGTPGPMNSLNAPPGHGEDFSLPADLPNAFDDPKCCPTEWLFSFGAIALQRQRMPQNALAINNGGIAMEFDDVRPNFNVGPRLGIGVTSGNQALELIGFYLPRHDSSRIAIDPGLQTYFFNNFGPLREPDELSVILQTTIGNYEFNYRTWSAAFTGAELIVGCRFFDLQERLAIKGRTAVSEETYVSRTFNRIVGPTLGTEYGIPLGGFAAVSLTGKGTWGWNIVNADVALIDNGFIRFEEQSQREGFAQVYEFGAFLDLWLADPLHIRMGCAGFVLLNVAEASDQINFDVRAPSNQNEDGSIFYWGPTIEVQIVW
jgi:hypothetical protein